MDLSQALGISNKESQSVLDQVELHEYINLKLASCGQPICVNDEISGISLTTQDMMRNYLEKSRQLASKRYPVDQRIQEFLDAYLSDLNLDEVPQLPAISFELDRHGIARELSITKGEQTYQSDYVTSYKVDQGVLHNPASDRRTTKGSFHVAAGGLPVAGDKKEVPLQTFAWLLKHAVDSTSELLSIPFCSNEPETAQLFASLLLRPTVCPEIPGIDYKKSMEVRFFAPGSLVSNLDFVESIFGNAGNPALPDNDAALDIKHWSGHTGCVILAPHLVNFTKQELGLPLNTWSKQAWLQPIQVLIRSGVPAAALLTNSGSAKNGRAIEIRSASPLAKTLSATSGVLIRLEVITGTVKCLRMVWVTQVKAARGTLVAMVGIRASCQPIPVLIMVAPAFSMACPSCTTSSRLLPSGTKSNIDRR